MALSGCISEYSFAEMFQYVQQGYKTGLLSVNCNYDLTEKVTLSSYVGFQKGEIIAYANDLDNLGLLAVIAQHGWINSSIYSILKKQIKYIQRPLGKHLKSLGILDDSQLKDLFDAQVIQPVSQLFNLKYARFVFEEGSALSYGEMTGLSVHASEVSLEGLRKLKDWSLLECKLPNPEFGLRRSGLELTKFQLDDQEQMILNWANGKISICQIAQRINLPLIIVQQIVFRLMIIGLVREVDLDFSSAVLDFRIKSHSDSTVKPETRKPALSASFFGGLSGFLKKRV